MLTRSPVLAWPTLEPVLHVVPLDESIGEASAPMTFNILPLLSAFAATDAPTSDRTKRSNGLSTDFPGEEPSAKELGDWLDENGPPLRTTFGALLRGETPTHLV